MIACAGVAKPTIDAIAMSAIKIFFRIGVLPRDEGSGHTATIRTGKCVAAVVRP
jgi:hypothetical protein